MEYLILNLLIQDFLSEKRFIIFVSGGVKSMSSSLRTFVRKISNRDTVNPVIVQQDELQWKEERESLLVSRICVPSEGEVTDLYPVRKGEEELGPPVPIPPMSAIRLSFLNRQREKQLIRWVEPDLKLFCQAFCKDKRHAVINEDVVKVYEEALAFGSTVTDKLRTQMILADWEAIPVDVDCIFIGVLLPKNSDGAIRDGPMFSSTGLLELLNLDDIDENQWMRQDANWPVWDVDSPVRIQMAEKDLFKLEPEFFYKNSTYSTYLCSKEMGLTRGYLWGK